MIACLKGVLISQRADKVIIMAGGVGYEVYLTQRCLSELPDEKEEVMVYVYTHVRDDALVLYGFATIEEKETFEILIGVSGIGPKLALAILSGMTPAEISRAVSRKETSLLTRLPGVGKRTAERICLELKDKIVFIPAGDLRHSSPPPGSFPQSDISRDVVSALINLGYSRSGSLEAVQRLIKADSDSGRESFEDLLKKALREVSLL
ncbi:MAG: Holliday junction branch migration protein RuvA [Thermodesulfobacteriota bacterium]